MATQSLSGKVVFITGAASGIGAEVSRRLHRMGCDLILADADGPGLAAMVAELGGGDRLISATADVRDAKAMENAASQGIQRFGGIDVVLANAGIMSCGSVLNMDPEVFKRVIEIDLLGVFHTVRAALASIIERKGYVLVVSSVAAYSGAPGLTPYNAAKAGVENFANGLRLEVAELGVAVGCAHMSWVDTPMVREATAEMKAFDKIFGNMLPGPLGKPVPVDKCADAFIAGMKKRKKHVFSPPWAALLPWMRPLLTTGAGEKSLAKAAAEFLPEMDADAAAIGRATSARVHALDGPST